MMKGYKKFIFSFLILLALYIVAELNRPKELDWRVTLSKGDKNPFGCYVLYHLMTDFFSETQIISTRRPVYNTLEENTRQGRSAYFLLEPDLSLPIEDRKALLDYASEGNFVVLSSSNFDDKLADTLKLQMEQLVQIANENLTISLVNRRLPQDRFTQTGPMTINGHFKKLDTARSTILGVNNLSQSNYISMNVGKGKILIHTLPLCFSNIFLLTDDNADYVSAVLSYLPADLKTIYWDEYYKLGPEGSTNLMRFLLQDPSLKWAYWIAVLAMVSLLVFESKRRQRIIPIVKPLRNSTLDFVHTVGNLYYSQKNNKNLALKKINHFTDFIRTKFYLSTNPMDEKFVTDLAAKTGFEETEINKLVELINYIQDVPALDDKTLLHSER